MTASQQSSPPIKFLTFRLARLQSRLNAQAIRLLRDHSELSLTEWRILVVSILTGDITLSELARVTQLDKGQLSRAVATMVDKKLLTSEINADDHRQHILSVTDAGRAAHEDVDPLMQERQTRLTSNFDEGDEEVLSALLDKLESSLDL